MNIKSRSKGSVPEDGSDVKKEDVKTQNGDNPAAGQKVSSEAIRQLLSDSQDVVFTSVIINNQRKLSCPVVFIDGLVNSKQVDDDILKPLIEANILSECVSEKEIIDNIMMGAVYHNQRSLRDKLSDCISDILAGFVALVFDASGIAITFETKGFEKRGITEPVNENVIKGSKESFIEVLRINTALVRRRLQIDSLKIQELKLGRRSKTTISIVYLSDVANLKTVEQVKQRLTSVEFDTISSAGQLEELILDNKHTFIPQVIYTERVDKFCASIAEGRIGIIIDGMPVTFIVPVDINAFLQAPEDYALNYIVSSLFRIMRHVCAFLALVLPAFYVSVTTFHQEMIPTTLAISIIRSKQGVPLPTYLEVLLMLLAFEVLLEAGLRLPKSVGQAVSIVGALVVGEAAIKANILSPGVVIIISSAGITGFVIPSQDLSNAVRICRLLFVILSITSGLFGVTIGLIILLYHLCSLEVFGVPYMSPFVGNEGRGIFFDTVIRKTWMKAIKRPSNIGPAETTRKADKP